jgi:hypothetical protein
MNQTLFGVLIFASQFLVALTLLFVAGSLIRIDLNWVRAAGRRFAKRPSQLVRDPRSLEEALVEFFAHSKEFSHILSVLIAHRKPLRVGAIVHEVRLEQHRLREDYVPPMSIAWAALCIMQVAGLVRISRHGFLITEVGREIHRRIEEDSAISAEDYGTPRDARTGMASVAMTEGHQPATSPLSRKTGNLNPGIRVRHIGATAPNH